MALVTVPRYLHLGMWLWTCKVSVPLTVRGMCAAVFSRVVRHQTRTGAALCDLDTQS